MPDHNIVHVDLPASNTEAAAKFYGDLFGWKISNWAEGNYWMFQPKEGPGGGFNPLGNMKLESGELPIKPGDLIFYVSTDDIEASLAQVEALGGTVVLPKTSSGGILWAIFADPTGNRIGLYADQPAAD